MALSYYTEILDKLSENAKPAWGIMTPQHMIEHLIQAIQLSNGKITQNECMNPTEKLPLLKRFLLSPRPLPKNFVNTVVGSELKPLINKNLQEALNVLKTEIKEIDNFFNSNPNALPMNPTFGPLNKEEWMQFHKKHFIHHITQFGLMNE